MKVESALDAGLNLGRGTLDALVELAQRTACARRPRLAAAPRRPIERRRGRHDAGAGTPARAARRSEVAIVGSNGQTLLAAGPRRRAAARPAWRRLLRQARLQRVVGQLEAWTRTPAAPRRRIRVLALVPADPLAEQERFLMVRQILPPTLSANALAVQTAYREYQQRALARDGLRRMYIGTLTLALVLAVFGAVLLAALLGNQLAARCCCSPGCRPGGARRPSPSRCSPRATNSAA